VTPLTANQRQWLLWGGIGLGLLWLVYLLRPILTPFVIAILLAYMIEPAVTWLAARKVFGRAVPRMVAVTIMVIVVVLIGLLLVLILVPLFTKQFAALLSQAPAILDKLNNSVLPLINQWTGAEIQLDIPTIKTWLTQYIQSSDGLGKIVWDSLSAGGLAIMAVLGNLLLAPLLLFYFSSDWPALTKQADASIPRPWYATVKTAWSEIDHVLAQFFRGQLSLMLALALYYAVGLKVAGLDFAFTIGIITGLLVFIPYIGFASGLILAALVGLLQFASDRMGVPGIIGVAAVFAIGQVLESFILTPKLVGERVGLPALAVLFALMAFGQLFGFFGVLVAVPASAILLVALRHLRSVYFDSSFYKG
jgi:predicted PurR-regulated permease PerM